MESALLIAFDHSLGRGGRAPPTVAGAVSHARGERVCRIHWGRDAQHASGHILTVRPPLRELLACHGRDTVGGTVALGPGER